MRRGFHAELFLLLWLVMTPTAMAGEEPVEHNLSVILEPGTHRLVVRDEVQLPDDLRKAGTRFTLCEVLSISASNTPVTKLETDEAGNTHYSLDEPPLGGTLLLTYEGAYDFGLSDEKEQYTRGFRDTRGIVGDEGAYLDGGSGWIPDFGDRMIRFTVDIAPPAGWHVISQGNGTSRDETGHAHWDSGGPLEQVYLVGGPLIVERDTAGAVEILVYLHERDEALSRKYLDATARYIEMYRQLIGRYPYEKFALVENFWETGYGMPSFTLLGPQVIRFPFILHSSYPHEILHNWWGNSVFVDYESGNWCEGLTAYMADHLIQEQRGRGEEYRRNTLQKYRNYVREGRDFPLKEFRNRHSAATEAVGYGKALMLFHMLRHRVGDDHFRTALAQFYRKQRGNRASFDDIQQSFENVVDDDLELFFDQWVDRTGAPSLALSNVNIRRAAGKFVVTGSLDQIQDADPYELDVPVYVRTENGWESHHIAMYSSHHSFQLDLSARPLMISVDPMFDVFRLLDPRETPPSIGQIFGAPQVLAVLPSTADRSAAERYRELMEAWQSDVHEIEPANDTEIDHLPDDRAVWILGRDNLFAEDFITRSEIDSGEVKEEIISLGDEEVPLDQHCIVVVHRNPHDDEKAIGWLAIEPEAAFPGVARKLPHYGKYSYLAFEGDDPTNIVKGQWDTANSPLVVDLREDKSRRLEPFAFESRAALAELPPIYSQRVLMEHIVWLADKEREGRGLGSEGLDESAQYIARHFAEAGLLPGGDNGTWFQKFTVENGPYDKPIDTVNVIGVLPGTRTDWNEQSIILGAHYDHLGYGWPDVHAGDEGKLHPGADDNASGIAVMLELAKNITAEGGGSRSLIFVAFSAEECGRFGSQHYVAHPHLPAPEIRGAINLDTIGRLFDGKLAIHGTGTADEWPHIFRGCSYVTGVESRNIPDMTEGSDQWSFITHGIPAVQIFTGAHEDYHRPTDTPDKIDGLGLVKVATFIKEALAYLLEREEPMNVRIEGTSAPVTKKPKNTGGRRVTFGTVPEFSYQGEGVMIASVVPDSPAAAAGLRAGDILVRIDDQAIADLRAFSNFLKTLEPGDVVTAVVLRDDEEITAQVTVRER